MEKIKKYINPLLVLTSAVLLFVHYFFLENYRTSWYLREIFGKISFLFMMIFWFRMRQYRHGLLDFVLKLVLTFFVLKLSLHIVDDGIAFIFNIHIHKFFMIMQTLPLTIVSLAVFFKIFFNKED